LETHPPFCTNADKMLETMEKVNHPNIRINFDTANIYYYNKFEVGDGIKEMEKVKQYIASIHLKESNGKPETWWFPPLGSNGGIVDYKKIFYIISANHQMGRKVDKSRFVLL
jgi:inosose dehydratase